MTNEGILYLAGVVSFGLTGLIIAQHTAPAIYRPVTIVRKTWRAFTDSVRQTRQGIKQANAEHARQQEAWMNRPCWQCHQQAPMAIVRKPKQSDGRLIAELLIILFVIAPLTCGFGLLMIPLLFIGRAKESFQRCGNCGAERPI